MRDLMLIRAVVVHLPDFFVTATAADEEDLAFRDAGDSTTEAEDDFIGELMRDGAGCIGSSFVLVLLTKNLRRGGVVDVKQPALHGLVAVGHAEISEGQHRS